MMGDTGYDEHVQDEETEYLASAFFVDEKYGTNSNRKEGRLSKSEKKRNKFDNIIFAKQKTRKQKKMERREKMKVSEHQEKMDLKADDSYVDKREALRIQREKCVKYMTEGYRFCIDLSLEHLMSEKEINRLVQQLCRLYGSNRKAEKPSHLYFTGLDKSGELYRECVKKNEGFADYLVTMHEESHFDVFQPEEIVYLSPDSDNVLTCISKNKVYVIGGLVDDNIHKGVTEAQANELCISTARLPIQEYMDKTTTRKSATWSQVLTVNQVFEIVLAFTHCQDWTRALHAGVPKRKGFVCKTLPVINSDNSSTN